MISFTYGAREAMDAQLKAMRTVDLMLSSKEPVIQDIAAGFARDEIMLRRAIPFAWTKETMRAVWAASESVPMDAQFNQWNLPAASVWWHFEELLPVRTHSNDDPGVRALLLGYPINSEQPHVQPNRFTGGCWCDVEENQRTLSPSQVFSWHQGTSVEQMLDYSRQQHNRLYGPGGRWHYLALRDEIVGVEIFLAAAKRLSQFILAATSWLASMVLVEETPHVERHARREYERKLGRAPEARIVHLRRHDRPKHEPVSEESKRDYSCQWMVDGHWRNQRVGVGRSETRLTWVTGHIRGPEDKPFRARKDKVFIVSR